MERAPVHPLRRLDNPWIFALMILLLQVALFPDVFLAGKVFFFRDFGLFGLPLAHFHRAAFWSGQFPFWNPYNDCGVPFFAQWNSLVLYPPTLLYLTLPVATGLTLFCLAHQMLGAVGMFFLVRRWTGWGGGALLAGIGFGFNGLTLSALMWPNNIAALGWLPWIVCLGQAGVARGGRSLWLACLLAGMQILTGAPEIIGFTWLLLALAVLLVHAPQVHGPDAKVSTWLGHAAMFAALSLGLAAVQWLPFLRFLTLSHRAAGYEEVVWSMPLTGLFHFWLPAFGSYVWNHGVCFQKGQYWTTSYYVGTGLTWLAALGLLLRFRWRSLGWVGISLGLLWVAMGPAAGLYSWLQDWVPGLGMIRYPIKWVTPVLFVIVLLAGVAGQDLRGLVEENRGAPFLRRVVATALLGLGLIWLALGWEWCNTHPDRLDHFRNLVLPNAGARTGFFAAFVTVVCLALTRRLRLESALPALAFITWLDLATHAPRQNPTVSPSAYAPQPPGPAFALRPPLTRYLTHSDRDFKVHPAFRTNAELEISAKLAGRYANLNLFYPDAKVTGFLSLHLRESYAVIDGMYESTNGMSDGLLDFLGVDRRAERPGTYGEWVSRASAMPLVTGGQKVLFDKSEEILLAVLRSDFDPRQSVYLPVEQRTLVGELPGATVKISDTKQTLNELTFVVEAGQAAVVTIAQSFEPAWTAVVNGQPVSLWRANYGFQALVVPPGRSVVQLRYADPAFRTGAWVSGFSALALGCLVWRRRCPKTRHAVTL
jgi:hypothetical protein